MAKEIASFPLEALCSEILKEAPGNGLAFYDAVPTVHEDAVAGIGQCL